MADRPSITVAVPTMNGSKHIRETIASILKQTGASFQGLITDDCSTDDTLECVRATAGDRMQIVVNSERLGLAGNWNRCVALCRTPWIAVIHQDDVIRPGHIFAHLSAIEADPSLGLVASASGVIDGRGETISAAVVERGGFGFHDRIFAAGEAVPLMAAGNPLRCSAVSIRTAVHAELGGFDARYRYVVDWEFWLRVARRWPLAWLATPTVDVRWHSESETQRFRTGTADLEETARLQNGLLAELKANAVEIGEIERTATQRLARAYLNRAHVALRGADGRLARDCLRRAVALWPGVLRAIVADPRLGVQMAAVWAAPERSGRWFGRSV